MKKILILVISTIIFASCENSLKENIEKIIISKLDNPESYEFVSLKLIDSVNNHEIYQNKLDSLKPFINGVSYKLLSTLYDIENEGEYKKIEKLSNELDSIRKILTKVKKTEFSKVYRNFKDVRRKNKKLTDKYSFRKRKKISDFDYEINKEDIFIWDSLIKMKRKKLISYFKKSQPHLAQRYGIEEYDWIVGKFILVDSLNKLKINSKVKIEHNIYELNFRAKNEFNALVLNKKEFEVRTINEKIEIIE